MTEPTNPSESALLSIISHTSYPVIRFRDHTHTYRTSHVSTSCMADTLDLVGLGGEGRKRIVIFKCLIKKHSLDPQVIKTGDPLRHRLLNPKFKLWSSKLGDGNGDGGFEFWSGLAFSYAPRWVCRSYTSRFLSGAFADTYFI